MKPYSLPIAFCFLLSACKVGPDYKTPDTPMPKAYCETKGEETSFSPSDEDLVGWWKMFNDPFLNELIQESVSGSFDYRIAVERIQESRSHYWVDFTRILPDFFLTGQASRFRASEAFKSSQTVPLKSTTRTSTSPTTVTTTSPAGTMTTTTSGSKSVSHTVTKPTKVSPVQNFFQAGFDAIWELDLFGKLRRSADSSYNLLEANEALSRDIKISVMSEVARIYIQICSYQQQLFLAQDIVESDLRLLRLSKERFNSGIRNEQEVEQLVAKLEQDRATLQTLEIALNKTIFSLSTLLGQEPEVLKNRFHRARAIPIARQKVPTGLPAELLKRRNDIRSAEREMAAATELVGVAIAQKYPSLSLTGSSTSFAANPLQGANIGFTSDRANKLFKHPARIWGIGGLLTVPIFDFGKRNAQVEAQLAVQRQAVLLYEKTVIAALEEVEGALTAYFHEEEREKSLAMAEKSERKRYDLDSALFRSGLIDRSQLLATQQIWIDANNTLTISRGRLTQNLIALYKSLGGDW